MAVRDVDKGLAAADRVRATVPDADIEVRQLDLGRLASVRAFAEEYLGERDRIDVLINNAGVMACPKDTTYDGFELQFGTNHLGHFLLTNLLAPALVAGEPARVVELSSRGHRFSDVDLDDPDFERTEYDPWVAYGRSKTANVLFAVGFDARYRDQGVRAFAVHPGSIQTELGRHLTDESLSILMKALPEGQELEWKTDPAGGGHVGMGGDVGRSRRQGGLVSRGLRDRRHGRRRGRGVGCAVVRRRSQRAPTPCGRSPNRWLDLREEVRSPGSINCWEEDR